MNVWDALQDLPRIRSKISKEPDSASRWVEIINELRSCRKEINSELKNHLLQNIDAVSDDLRLGRQCMEKKLKNKSPLFSWYEKDGDGRMIFNHNSRGHMAKDIQRYFIWSSCAQHMGKSPGLWEIPSYIRPEHKNIDPSNKKNVPFVDRFKVQVAGKPSTTVVSHISKDGHYYIHCDPLQCRSLSVREAARLQTFPDNYFFEGAPTDQYRQVGNAVPPYLAYQIAQLVHSILAP